MVSLYYDSLRAMKDSIQESIEDSYDPITESFHLHPRSIVAGYVLGGIAKNICELSDSVLSVIEADISDDIKIANIEHICKKRKELEDDFSERIERMFRVAGINYNKELICKTKWDKEIEKDQHFD